MTKKEAIDKAFKSITPRYKLAQFTFSLIFIVILIPLLFLLNLNVIFLVMLTIPVSLISFKLTEILFKIGKRI